MTSPSALKAAGEICVKHLGRAMTIGDDDVMTPIIQQALTEAVDAAVAPKEKRIAELEKQVAHLEFNHTRNRSCWER